MPMLVTASLVLTIIGGHEKPVVSSTEPQLDGLLGVHVVGSWTRDGRTLLDQVIHRTVPNPAAQNHIDTRDTTGQATAAAPGLHDTLLRRDLAIDDIPDR